MTEPRPTYTTRQRPRIELFPTRRWAGFTALVWASDGRRQHVYQAFFGRNADEVMGDARQYAEAMAGYGVEDAPGQLRGPGRWQA